jgi:membrane glycosyltransferase
MSLVEPISRAWRVSARWPGPRAAVFGLAGGLTLAIVAAFAASVTDWTPAAIVALPFVLLSAVWISGGAATAILGLVVRPQPRLRIPSDWQPTGRTAILFALCKEAPGPLADHLGALREGLDRVGLERATQIFVLSDTSGADLIAAEEAALASLIASGAIVYRRRATNTGRKPGNIADWLFAHGDGFDHMMVLDCDSRMTPDRIRAMIHQIDRRPALGLLQAGIALVPGRTRLGRHQRAGARLLSRGFGRGFAAWTGESGNYWGHNAIIRVAAFRAAAALPVLRGHAPFGGALLSHDFIEAAWIRRAGWAVELDPEMAGSAEDAPQTLAAFHARDRRWCQGNLQHLCLIAEPGLDPISRVHLAMGILSYLVAPVWLMLVLLVTLGLVPVAGALPLATVVLVLLIPKLCALLDWWRRAGTLRRRVVVVRAWLGELATSTLIAPLVMLRQSGAVMAVCLGRDCGWKAAHRDGVALPRGTVEALAGAGLVALAVSNSVTAALWLAPVALPLCCAPLIVSALDRPA